MYWVRANGTIEELKGRDTRLNGIGAPMTNSLGPQVNDAPPNSAPIDLRGYQFPPNFFQNYPNFPRTSDDHAFTTTQNVDGFLRDQAAGIQYGTPSGVINGTVSATASPGIATPVGTLGGGVTVINTLTSTITAYVPMKDGGYAVMSYEKRRA